VVFPCAGEIGGERLGGGHVEAPLECIGDGAALLNVGQEGSELFLAEPAMEEFDETVALRIENDGCFDVVPPCADDVFEVL